MKVNGNWLIQAYSDPAGGESFTGRVRNSLAARLKQPPTSLHSCGEKATRIMLKLNFLLESQKISYSFGGHLWLKYLANRSVSCGRSRQQARTVLSVIYECRHDARLAVSRKMPV